MPSPSPEPAVAPFNGAPLRPAFLLALPLSTAHRTQVRSPLRRPVCAAHSDHQPMPISSDVSPAPPPTARLPRLLLTVAAAALAPATAFFLPIQSAHAARDKSVITMTDQVPNFTLPSQEQAVSPDESRFAPVLRVANFAARRVLPPVAALALAVWGVRTAMRRAQERQLRDFQTQLSSFSSMLDLDKSGSAASGDARPPVKDGATRAREMLDGSKSRFRFRGDAKTADNTELSSKVQLDLFSPDEKAASAADDSATDSQTTASVADPVAPSKTDSAAATASAATMPVTPTEIADTGVDIGAAKPSTPLEQAVADALADARAGRAGGAVARVAAAQAASGVSPGEATAAVTAYLSRALSAAIDGAAGQLNEKEEASVLTALQDLGQWMGAARTVAPDARLRYGGRHAGDDSMVEEIYRRYALFCLSGAPGEEAAGAGVAEGEPVSAQGLADMQAVLGLGDARAETINTEIAKGMFQVAVSAAVADGSLSDEDKQALESVKESFGSYLDGSSADSIVSEVAVMRAMYSLQQLLQEQGVSADDVKELRKMCKELGVDIDEMLQNADAMGDALGPEAKQFVESLRGLLTSTDAAVDKGGETDGSGGNGGGAALGAA